MSTYNIIMIVLTVIPTIILYTAFFSSKKKESDIEQKDRLYWRLLTSNNDKVRIEDFRDYLYNTLLKDTVALFPTSKKVKQEYEILFNEIFMAICDHIAEHHRMDNEYYYIDARKLDELMKEKIKYYYKLVAQMGPTYFDLKRIR